MKLKLSSIEKYNRYINNLPIHNKYKQILLEKNEILKNPLFYLNYASLFKNAYNFRGETKKIELLDIAGFLIYKYSLLMDSYLDEKSEDVKLNVAISAIYLEEFIKILTLLFGDNKNYWKFYNQRKLEFYNSSKMSDDFIKKDSITIKDYENLSDLKSGLGKLAIDSLHFLSNSEDSDLHKKMLLSHKYFSIGFQITDDISDIYEDYQNKQFNFASYSFREQITENVEIEDLNKLIYIEGTAVELYNLAKIYFQKSITVAESIGINNWIEVVENKIEEVENAIHSINEYLLLVKTRNNIITNSKKIRISKITIKKGSVIEKGLFYISKEWEKDFPEIKHIMILPERDGFNNNDDVHVTDIFQRAILTDNLIDLNSNYNNTDIQLIIDEELEYLIKNKNSDKNGGGWSYFPTVKEIAPDADDLGQMLQILSKTGNNKFISQYCLSLIEILITDRRDNQGGIETWILPKKGKNKLQIIQDKYNRDKWGKGPDVEVMANFLYGLTIYNSSDYNSSDYNSVIETGVTYITNKMTSDFFWESEWYYGWLYGTMVSLRLLVKVTEDKKTLNNICLKIISEQNSDGGWGIHFNKESDSLNTSFALLCLKNLREILEVKTIHIKKALVYLEKKQNPDGSWDAINFIIPRLGAYYKSKTITTSYVLNVLSYFK